MFKRVYQLKGFGKIIKNRFNSSDFQRQLFTRNVNPNSSSNYLLCVSLVSLITVGVLETYSEEGKSYSDESILLISKSSNVQSDLCSKKHNCIFDDNNAKLDVRLAKKLYVFNKVNQDFQEMFDGPKLNDKLFCKETITIPRTHKTGSENINDIKLYITKPSSKSMKGKSCSTIVVQLHGGAMISLSPLDANYRNNREYLTNEGVIVVGVDFENGPYPRGLNDCVDAVKWVIENKSKIMGDYNDVNYEPSIVMFGDSGGANLALAATQCLLHDTSSSSTGQKWIDHIDGIYCSAPYIAGPSYYKSKHYASYKLYSSGKYLLPDLTEMAVFYAPSVLETSIENQNPLIWPLHTSFNTLSKMPPHKISVNEFDPLRDEGVAYHNKLIDAGTHSQLRVIKGTFHCSDYMIATVPEIADATFKDIKGFCDMTVGLKRKQKKMIH